MVESKSVNQRDLSFLKRRGLAAGEIEGQVQLLQRGPIPIQLERPCRIGDGVRQLSDGQIDRLRIIFQEAAGQGRAMKFVPASGAASRMFRELAEATQHPGDPAQEKVVRRFFENPEAFGFWPVLRSLFAGQDRHLEDQEPLQVIQSLLEPDGMGYRHLPKGLVHFHRYGEESRTAFQEHLIEAAALVSDQEGTARVHFTVPAEHRERIEQHLRDFSAQKAEGGTQIRFALSSQDPSTDTIALEGNGGLLRDADGALVFRPGGHGSLLRNLEAAGGDIVFVKNIDNLVRHSQLNETVRLRQALGGLLLELQNRIFEGLRMLREGPNLNQSLIQVQRLIEEEFRRPLPEGSDSWSEEEKGDWLSNALARPLRICGVVRNLGEPGGGPFWVSTSEGVTAQIVESSQIDPLDTAQLEIWNAATHFNPVDMVCSLRDEQGKAFKLEQFCEKDAGLISTKYYNGRQIRILEWPGLWNGGMAGWNTVFVEVPLTMFNPVKTVFDLLRESHRFDPDNPSDQTLLS